jgi:hypothetical protein
MNNKEKALKEKVAKLNEEEILAVKNDHKLMEKEFSKTNRPSLPESLFISSYIPIWLKLVKPTDDNGSEISIAEKWVKISGRLTSEVDLVDVDGNVVNTVPPMVSTDNIDTNIQRYPLNDFGQKFVDQLENNPHKANSTLKGILKVIDENTNTTHKETWISFWNGYKDIMTTYLKGNTIDTTKEAVVDVNNDFDL